MGAAQGLGTAPHGCGMAAAAEAAEEAAAWAYAGWAAAEEADAEAAPAAAAVASSAILIVWLISSLLAYPTLPSPAWRVGLNGLQLALLASLALDQLARVVLHGLVEAHVGWRAGGGSEGGGGGLPEGKAGDGACA